MADGNYARLIPGGLGLAALIPKKSGRGGKRPGAGRPKGSKAQLKPAPMQKMCGCGNPVGPGRHAYCEPCGTRIKAAKRRSGCDHPKPLFSNGKERKVCYDCAPKPTPKARKPYSLKQQTKATCHAPGCEVQFTPNSHHQHFCSDGCRNKVCNRAGQERRRNSAPRPCRWCGVSYVPEYGSHRLHYCTLECRAAAAKKVRNGSSHRRRAIKFGCHYEAVNKRKVFEQDGWRCYLCGCDTPKQASGTGADNAPELDHVVPLAKGGAHAYSNVRCACRKCNRLKGATLMHPPRHPIFGPSEADTAHALFCATSNQKS